MVRLFVLLAAALATGPLAADLFQFNVTMSGGQEVPPNGSTATGTAIVIFNDVSGLMTVNGTYTGLSAPSTAAHVHGFAPAGVNAGVQFALTHSSATSGTLTGSFTFGSGNFANVLNGLTYINVHNSTFPGGEIRGQISNPFAIPEPAAAGLLTGLLAFTGIASRRRRAV
jgi:CHRD domain